MTETSSRDPDVPAKVPPALEARPWRGDDHQLQVDAAREIGLRDHEMAVDLYTEGFKSGITVEDPTDGAIVARGRTVLRCAELERAVTPMLRYLGVSKDAVRFRVDDGEFEIRIASRAAESSGAALSNAKIALQLWLGFGLLGVAVYGLVPAYRWLAALVWSAGLLLGAWQLRRGIVSGRAMVAAQVAVGLAMLASEEQMILPPAENE